jgi:hypothetical protein
MNIINEFKSILQQTENIHINNNALDDDLKEKVEIYSYLFDHLIFHYIADRYLHKKSKSTYIDYFLR